MPFPQESRPVLFIIVVSLAMIVVDNSIVFTGLSNIKDELAFTDAGLSWVSTVYALTCGGFLLLGARSGDMFGQRRVYIVGLALFSLASLVIAVAPFAGLLVAARAIQGMGAAILAPRAVRRFGNGAVLCFTIVCCLCGIGALYFVSAGSTYWGALAIPTMLVGIGQGGSIAPLTTAGIGILVALASAAMLSMALVIVAATQFRVLREQTSSGAM